jgi:hypothetical protein
VEWRDALGVSPYSRLPVDVKALRSLGKGRNRLAHVHGRTLGRGEQGGELRFSGDALTLDQLPEHQLRRLAGAGLSAETVSRCNAAALADEPTDDPDDLPATWAASA